MGETSQKPDNKELLEKNQLKLWESSASLPQILSWTWPVLLPWCTVVELWFSPLDLEV